MRTETEKVLFTEAERMLFTEAAQPVLWHQSQRGAEIR